MNLYDRPDTAEFKKKALNLYNILQSSSNNSTILSTYYNPYLNITKVQSAQKVQSAPFCFGMLCGRRGAQQRPHDIFKQEREEIKNKISILMNAFIAFETWDYDYMLTKKNPQKITFKEKHHMYIFMFLYEKGRYVKILDEKPKQRDEHKINVFYARYFYYLYPNIAIYPNIASMFNVDFMANMHSTLTSKPSVFNDKNVSRYVISVNQEVKRLAAALAAAAAAQGVVLNEGEKKDLLYKLYDIVAENARFKDNSTKYIAGEPNNALCYIVNIEDSQYAEYLKYAEFCLFNYIKGWSNTHPSLVNPYYLISIVNNPAYEFIRVSPGTAIKVPFDTIKKLGFSCCIHTIFTMYKQDLEKANERQERFTENFIKLVAAEKAGMAAAAASANAPARAPAPAPARAPARGSERASSRSRAGAASGGAHIGRYRKRHNFLTKTSKGKRRTERNTPVLTRKQARHKMASHKKYGVS